MKHVKYTKVNFFKHITICIGTVMLRSVYVKTKCAGTTKSRHLTCLAFCALMQGLNHQSPCPLDSTENYRSLGCLPQASIIN